MTQQDSGIFISSELIDDTPQKDKENAEPGDTLVARQAAGDGASRSARKSLLGRRRSSVGRRLSGFGGGGYDANTDQTKLTNMYTSIIKLNSENKITRDKCWGLHLIDYMEKVILEEGREAGGSRINFQKASCTIDASVKIYSHRVDATHQSSYSLLENLNRTDTEQGGRGGSSGAALGSSETSTKLGVQATLKKAEQLNQSEMDRASEVDPMFHKISKIFDEAGSKSMLLNNLNVSDGCKVSFDSEVQTAPPSPEVTNPRTVPQTVPGDDKTAEDGGNNADGSEPRASTATTQEDFSTEEEPSDTVRPVQVVDDGCDTTQGPTMVEAAGDDGDGKDVSSCGDNGTVGNPEEAVAVAKCGGMVDVSSLRAKLSDLCSDLSTLALCPQLQEIRDQIAVVNDTSLQAGRRSAALVGIVTDGDDSDSDGGGGGGGLFGDIPGGDDASFDGGDMGGDGADVVGGTPSDGATSDFPADVGDGWGSGVGAATSGADGVPTFGSGLSFGADGVGSGSAGVYGIGGGSSAGLLSARSAPAGVHDRLCSDLKVVNDDYAFYESRALAAATSSNSWAGASHWKFAGAKKKTTAPPKQSQTSSGVDGDTLAGEGEEEGGSGRRSRCKRKAPAIDFDAPAVPESALAVPKRLVKGRGGKRPQDPTVLSEEYVKRARKAAEDGTSTYALPENAGFKAKDLGELFLRPGAFAKCWIGFDGALGRAGGGVSSGQPSDFQGFHDSVGSGGGDGEDLLFADANDGYVGGGEYDDDDDDCDSEGFHFAEGLGVGEEGAGVVGEDGVFVDDFKATGLISANRRVEKIDVNFARKAKRVDVRRLKGDLWRRIEGFHPKVKSEGVGGDADEGDEGVNKTADEDNEAGNEEKGDDGAAGLAGKDGDEEDAKRAPEVVDMTFSDIMLDVASKEKQSGVTVPFYFICVLHLANEKGLRLEGRDDLLDFSVASDPVKEGSY